MVDVKSTGDGVAQYMTRDPLLVRPETRLVAISKNFLSPERRLVVVVDAEQRPIGILSSKDILVALAAANHKRGIGASTPTSDNGQVLVRRPVQTSTW
jgi:CBS domain-containing protein